MPWRRCRKISRRKRRASSTARIFPRARRRFRREDSRPGFVIIAVQRFPIFAMKPLLFAASLCMALAPVPRAADTDKLVTSLVQQAPGLKSDVVRLALKATETAAERG